MLRTKTDLCVTAMSVLLLVSTVHGYTDEGRLRGAVTGEVAEGRQRRGDGGGRGGEDGCQEGWLSTHHYCLLYTGLGEEEAEVYCAKRGALQVRGICVTKPLPSDEAHLEAQQQSKENLDALAPPSSSSSSSSFGHQCPSGWAQVQDYCYFNPGPASKICELLGAQYMLNLCVARVPHEIPVDFMHAVKRLHGDDNHFDRDTRLCCCLGGGLCK